MLVLSRKTGQKICIGEDIVITVVSINGKRAKIGIEAPEYCQIVREEILAEAESDSLSVWKDDNSRSDLEVVHS